MSYMTMDERDRIVRRLREVPISQVRRECVERGRPRSYITLARLAKADDDARDYGVIHIGDAANGVLERMTVADD